MDRVRPAGPDDVSILTSLMIEFYAEADFILAPGAAARTFAKLIDAPDLGRVWLLESDGQPAGFVVLTVSFSMEFGGLRGFVDDFFVRKAFRRHGLGAAALMEVKAECVRRGVRALMVETGPTNRQAQRVYQRAGFVDAKRMLLMLPLAAPVHIDETGTI